MQNLCEDCLQEVPGGTRVCRECRRTRKESKRLRLVALLHDEAAIGSTLDYIEEHTGLSRGKIYSALKDDPEILEQLKENSGIEKRIRWEEKWRDLRKEILKYERLRTSREKSSIPSDKEWSDGTSQTSKISGESSMGTKSLAALESRLREL